MNRPGLANWDRHASSQVLRGSEAEGRSVHSRPVPTLAFTPTFSCLAVGSSTRVPSAFRAQVTPQKRARMGTPASTNAMQAAFRQQARSWVPQGKVKKHSRNGGGLQSAPLPPSPHQCLWLTSPTDHGEAVGHSASMEFGDQAARAS